MSIAQLARAHYNNKIRPKGLKQIILPQADGVTCGGAAAAADGAGVTYGDWVNVALKAEVLVDTLVVGILVDTAAAGKIYTIDLGSTCVTVTAGGITTTTNYANAAAVFAVAAAIEPAHRCEIRIEVVSAVGAFMPVMLPFPVLYNALTDGILARISTVNAVADTANISVVCIQAYE